MKKSLEIRVNPEVLKELRATSGYTVEEIAKKLKTTSTKAQEAEERSALLTLTQIKRLADIYHRPLAAFFTDTLPKMPLIPDYRINREKRLTPQVYIAQRRAYYLANKLTELTEKKSQIPNFLEEMKANELALEFRNYLKVELLKSIKPEELLAYYKKILEEKLSILVIELLLKADDVRGFSIPSNLSIIVLNEEDKLSSVKLFSLFHEVCHLIKRTSGICSIEIEQKNKEIESFCNLFSAEFLVPLDDLKEECKRFLHLDETAISELSKIYGVSKQVIMLRLLWLRYIPNEKYNQFKKKDVDKLKEKEKTFGRKNWNKVFQNRVGNSVIRETANAYRSGKISYAEVFDILNIKAKYIEKFVEW